MNELTLLAYFGFMLIIRKKWFNFIAKKIIIVSFSIFIQSQFNYFLRFQIAFESSETFFNCQKFATKQKKLRKSSIRSVVPAANVVACKAKQSKVKLHQQEMEKNSWLNSQSILKILNLNFVACQCWTNLFGSKTCFCPLPAWLSW